MTEAEPDTAAESTEDTGTGTGTGTGTKPSSSSHPDRQDAPGRSAGPWTPAFLTRIRRRRRWRVRALLIATIIGFSAAWLHWLGLFVAGGLLGLVTRSLGRAVLAAVMFGCLLLITQVLLIPSMNVTEFLALRPPVYVTVGVGLGAPVWGSLIRGVI